jgi:iron complex outermembrane receptor protein
MQAYCCRPKIHCRELIAAVTMIGASSSLLADKAPRDTRSSSIEEVIVSAQRRDEALKDVPISISVLSGDDLDQSSAPGVGEMLNRVPGVTFDNSFGGITGGSQLQVRGVSAPTPYQTGPTPVAYYVDATPFGLVRSAITPDANIYDLERVEVLRGPQGTLYGASALNGVVRILTKSADLQNFELKSRALLSHTQYGSENGQADVAINVPLIENKLAARAVLGYQDLSGWIDKSGRDDVNDVRRVSGRVKVKAQPIERLYVDISVWKSRSDSGGFPTSTDTNGRNSSVADVESVAADLDSYGLSIGYDYSAFTISSSTSYLQYLNDSTYDQNPDGTNHFVETWLPSKVFTQEFGVTSVSQGPWRWTVGAMYRDGRDKQFQIIYNLANPNSVTYTSKSWTVFGELTRAFLSDKIELTAGMRYFEDEVGQQHHSSFGNSPPILAADAKDRFTASTPRFIINWHPAENTTLYASYSEGFRSGLQQAAAIRVAVPSFPSAKPDTLKNYEIGAKGELRNGALGYDIAAYYMDWQDVQIPLSVIVNNVAFNALTNGASASGAGAELMVNARPIEGLNLSATGSWNDLATDKQVFSGRALLLDRGDRLGGSIKTTIGAAASYDFALSNNGWRGRFSLEANRRSASATTGIVGGVRIRAGYPLLTSRTSFNVDSPYGWSGTLFVDNLTNEQDFTYVVPTNVVGAPVPTYYFIRPRTYGFQLEYRL